MIKKLRVTIEGKTYEVEVEVLEQSGASSGSEPKAPPLYPTEPMKAPATAPAPAPVPAASTPAASAAPATAGPGVIPSPLAGNVVAVNTEVGRAVKSGNLLLTLEAMKMNTFIFADHPGTVQEIHVEVGTAVAEGQPLIKVG